MFCIPANYSKFNPPLNPPGTDKPKQKCDWSQRGCYSPCVSSELLCCNMILFWYLYFMLAINARLHPHYRQILTKVLDGSHCMLQGSPQPRSRLVWITLRSSRLMTGSSQLRSTPTSLSSGEINASRKLSVRHTVQRSSRDYLDHFWLRQELKEWHYVSLWSSRLSLEYFVLLHRSWHLDVYAFTLIVNE